MIKKIVLENKERDDLYKKLQEYGSLEIFYYIEKEEEGKIIKNQKYMIIAVPKEEVNRYIKEYLSTIGTLMQIQIYSEVKEIGGIWNININSDNNSIMIGKSGKNIDALQWLLKQSLKNQTEISFKINLDASDYKVRKQNILEQEVKNIAQEVLKTKIEVKLDPMNAYNRKIVHSIISSYDQLETESIGYPPNRYVIIKYKEL